MSIRILHTNDFHGRLTLEKAQRLSELRAEADFYFDCGDCIKAGNLAVPLREDPAWDRLAELRCTASVLGNRETHPIEAAFHLKMSGAKHPILCGNLKDRRGGKPLGEHLVLEHRNAKIGVLAVMVPMVTEKMKTQVASAYLWDPPILTAKRIVSELKPHVDVLIALTHIGFAQDKLLAQQVPEIDLIIGGHSHTVLEQPVVVQHTLIVQAGSHGRFAGMIEFEPGSTAPDYKLVPLP